MSLRRIAIHTLCYFSLGDFESAAASRRLAFNKENQKTRATFRPCSRPLMDVGQLRVTLFPASILDLHAASDETVRTATASSQLPVTSLPWSPRQCSGKGTASEEALS